VDFNAAVLIYLIYVINVAAVTPVYLMNVMCSSGNKTIDEVFL